MTITAARKTGSGPAGAEIDSTRTRRSRLADSTSRRSGLENLGPDSTSRRSGLEVLGASRRSGLGTTRPVDLGYRIMQFNEKKET